MKHIHKFVNLNEAGKSPVPSAPSAVTPIGFIIYLRNCWYYGAFPTFHDFASLVYEDFSGMDVEGEFFGEMALLKQSLWKTLDDNGMGGELASDDVDSSSLWWGMTPKCAPNILLQHYFPGNPYTASKALDLAFSGTKTIMDKWTSGRERDLGYIGLSIQNDPLQFDMYIEKYSNKDDDDKDFTFSDIVKVTPVSAIASYMKMNPMNLDLLDPFPKIKGEVIKIADIKDTSTLARGLRRGLI